MSGGLRARAANARSALREWAGRLKRDVLALWLAARDPRTPWSARLLAMAVAAYALSPIDLIPDFIPVLGYLDDLLIVPLGIAACLRLIPPPLMQQLRAEAARLSAKPRSLAAATAIVLIWVGAAFLAARYLLAD